MKPEFTILHLSQNEWRQKDSTPHKKFKKMQSAGEGIATVFWDLRGVIFEEFQQCDNIIKAECCSNL